MSPSERERAAGLVKRVTVGIVTALEEERAAMLAMLERPARWSFAGQGAGLTYDLGEIRAHDGGVHVIALALADMGNNIAAARGTLLLQHFPAVEAILMVGIAGGVPNPAKVSDHVRLGDVLPPNLSNLATVLHDLGDAAGARPLLERALGLDEKTFGPEHLHVAIRLSNLATVLTDLGEAAVARLLLEPALTIVETRLPLGHPYQGIFRRNLAALGPGLPTPSAGG